MPPLRRRGPYKRYLQDPTIPIPRTSAWVRRNEEVARQLLEDRRLEEEDNFEYAEVSSNNSSVHIHESPGSETSSAGSIRSEPTESVDESSDHEEASDIEQAEQIEVQSMVSELSSSPNESEVDDGTSNDEMGMENNSETTLSSDLSSASDGEAPENIPPLNHPVIQAQIVPVDDGGQHRYGVNQPAFQPDHVHSQPLYCGAQISKEESDILIMSFIIRWGLEEKGIEDLLRLIDCHLPASTMGSRYLFLKKFRNLPAMKVRYFCPQCLDLLPADINEFDCTCGFSCNVENIKEGGNDFFIQLSVCDQIKQIMNNNDLVKSMRKECQESDVVNGKVYQRLRNKGGIGDDDLTLQWNVDGVKPFKSSKVSIYPIQAAINELPYRERREHMILCGLFYGKKRPNINAFLKPFVNELTSLHTEGVNCEIPGKNAPTNVKVHTILSSVDSVERPVLQGIKQFNGKNGCSFCLRRGRQIPRGRGHSRVYVGGLGQSRTLNQHIEALNRLRNYNRTHRRKKRHIEGVKRATVLLLLPMFNIIKSFVPDYLHAALEGTVETFLKFWMSAADSRDREWYLTKDKLRTLNERLGAIKPPVEITRAARDTSQLALWKASELRSFLLYYSVVCLKGLLPSRYLRHWFLFVYSMSVMLKETISSDELRKASSALKKFVANIEVLYPNCHFLYTFNTHLLLHIPKAVEDFGALWASSTFPFEHFNGVLARLIKGTESVPQQICRSYLRLRQLWAMSSQVFTRDGFSEVAKSFYDSMLGKTYSSHLSQLFDDGLRLFGSPENYSLSLVERVAVEQFLDFSIHDNVESFRRFIYKGTVYHASVYNTLTVRNNSTIMLRNGHFLEIKRILLAQKFNSVVEKFCVILGELFEVLEEELTYDRELDIFSSAVIHVCQSNGRVVASCPQNITAKCVSVPYGNSVCVIPLVNGLERD